MSHAIRQVLSTAIDMQTPPAGAVRIHFDAGRQGVDPIIYARVDAADLCRIPTDELSVLGIGSDMPDAGGDPIFFAGNDSDLFLYVDLDAYPNFQSEMAAVVQSRGLCLAIARGDWAAMTNDEGEFIAPDIPGFVSDGYQKISPSVALVILEEMNSEWRKRSDDQGPELH